MGRLFPGGRNRPRGLRLRVADDDFFFNLLTFIFKGNGYTGNFKWRIVSITN